MRNLFLLLATFCMTATAALAQNVAGKVTDATNGGGLPGVSVVVEGANVGVMTDMNGA